MLEFLAYTFFMGAIHIPLEDLYADTRALLARARESGDLFVDGDGQHFKISRMPGRTGAEALEMIRNSPYADAEVDDGWASDMREVLALRHSEPYRDLWE